MTPEKRTSFVLVQYLLQQFAISSATTYEVVLKETAFQNLNIHSFRKLSVWQKQKYRIYDNSVVDYSDRF